MYACAAPAVDGTCAEWVTMPEPTLLPSLSIADAQSILIASAVALAIVWAWRVLRSLF